MRLAVVGSRTITDENLVFGYLDSFRKTHRVDLVISGGAKGVDTIAEGWAKQNGIEIRVIHPDYHSHLPRVAPLIRNREIVNLSDYVIAFWDGQSRGTSFVIDYAKKTGKQLDIIRSIFP